jgi:glycosyltransferase involved in cell wall biosynthesis
LLRSQDFDVIWVNFLILVDALPADVVGNRPVVLDQHECEELVYQGYLQRGTWAQRLFSLINLIKIRNFQRQTLSRINTIICVSKDEAVFTQRRAPEHVTVWVVPNGVDTEFFRPDPVPANQSNRILLCGNMSVRRNVDAAVWFARDIFPQVREAIADAEFWVVGSSPMKEVTSLAQIQGVYVTGTVDDVRQYYNQAKVVVAPFKFGAGTKLKVLEALAMARPIVATSNDCQGISMQPGCHFSLADTPRKLCQCVIELMCDPEKAATIAQAGRALDEAQYSWSQIVEALDTQLQAVVADHRNNGRSK